MERESAERGSLGAGGSWENVQTREDVETMRRLRGLGWGTKRIAAELGCSRKTVKRWLALERRQPYGRPRRKRTLEGLEGWLKERFHRHAGNADVVHQGLVAEHGIAVSLRKIARARRPRRTASSIHPRYGSHALACGLRPGASGGPPGGSVEVAAPSESVDTSMAGFAGAWPQRPAGRTDTPAVRR